MVIIIIISTECVFYLYLLLISLFCFRVKTTILKVKLLRLVNCSNNIERKLLILATYYSVFFQRVKSYWERNGSQMMVMI